MEVTTSIIMPTYNKADRLKLTLLSFLNLRQSEDLELIIINDGSQDDTVAVIENFMDKYQQQIAFSIFYFSIKNSGRSSARNFGIAKSKGDLIIFSDDDLILNSDFIIEHQRKHLNCDNLVVRGEIRDLPFLKFFKDPTKLNLLENKKQSSLVGFLLNVEMILNHPEQLKEQYRLSKFEKDIHQLFKETTFQNSCFRWVGATGGNLSVKKNNLIKVGAFDSCFGRGWGCEDLELGYRLYKNGCLFDIAHQAINYHMTHHRLNWLENHKKALDYFSAKYQDFSLVQLEKYFSGEILSLVEWKKISLRESQYVI